MAPCWMPISRASSAWRLRSTTETWPVLTSAVSIEDSRVSIWSSRCWVVAFWIGQMATTGWLAPPIS